MKSSEILCAQNSIVTIGFFWSAVTETTQSVTLWMPMISFASLRGLILNMMTR